MNHKKPSEGKRILGLWLSVTLVLCCALLVAAGCISPQQAGVKMNDTIQVFYTVSFPDGTEFQSNANGTPLEFTVGSGDVIAGFDEAVIGMTPGMVKTVTLSPEKGYGPYQQQLVNNMDTSQVIAYAEKLKAEGNFEVIQYPAIGPVAIWKKPDGTIGYIRFTNITNATTTVDENHPLAGKDLIFEITLVQIVNSTA